MALQLPLLFLALLSSQATSSAPFECPPGSQPSGATCLPCTEGWYSLGRNLSCQTCPISPLSPTPPADCTGGNLTLFSGFYRDYAEDKSPYLSNLTILYPCIHAPACMANAGMNSTSHYCAEGYQGPLCALCQEGFALHNFQCTPCATRAINITLLLLIPSLFFLFVVYVGVCRENKKKTDASIGIRLLMTFVSTLGALGLWFVASGPPAFKIATNFGDLLGSMSLFKTDPVQCIVPIPYYVQFGVTLALPGIIGCLSIIASICGMGIRGISEMWRQREWREGILIFHSRPPMPVSFTRYKHEIRKRQRRDTAARKTLEAAVAAAAMQKRRAAWASLTSSQRGAITLNPLSSTEVSALEQATFCTHLCYLFSCSSCCITRLHPVGSSSKWEIALGLFGPRRNSSSKGVQMVSSPLQKSGALLPAGMASSATATLNSSGVGSIRGNVNLNGSSRAAIGVTLSSHVVTDVPVAVPAVIVMNPFTVVTNRRDRVLSLTTLSPEASALMMRGEGGGGLGGGKPGSARKGPPVVVVAADTSDARPPSTAPADFVSRADASIVEGIDEEGGAAGSLHGEMSGSVTASMEKAAVDDENEDMDARAAAFLSSIPPRRLSTPYSVDTEDDDDAGADEVQPEEDNLEPGSWSYDEATDSSTRRRRGTGGGSAKVKNLMRGSSTATSSAVGHDSTTIDMRLMSFLGIQQPRSRTSDASTGKRVAKIRAIERDNMLEYQARLRAYVPRELHLRDALYDTALRIQLNIKEYFAAADYLAPIIFVLNLGYASLVSTSWSWFKLVCSPYTIGGYRYVLSDFTIRCNEASALAGNIFGGFLIILFVAGIPLFFLVLLWKNRKKLHEVEVFARFGFAYDGYRLDPTLGLYAWESVNLGRKALLVMSGALARDAYYQVSLSISLLVLSVYLQMYFRPYVNNNFNMLEAGLFVVLILSQMIAIFYYRLESLRTLCDPQYNIDHSLIDATNVHACDDVFITEDSVNVDAVVSIALFTLNFGTMFVMICYIVRWYFFDAAAWAASPRGRRGTWAQAFVGNGGTSSRFSMVANTLRRFSTASSLSSIWSKSSRLSTAYTATVNRNG